MSRRFTFLSASLCSLAVITISAQPVDWHDVNAVADAAAAAHPGLRRIAAEVDSARERAAGAGAVPSPMLMAGVQDLQVDLTRDEMMTMGMIGASQAIPRPARREAERAAADRDADRIAYEADSLRQEARRDALFAWYEIAAADSRIEVLQQVGKAIDGVVDAVRARYEAGDAIQADIIRAQMQRSDVDHQILTATAARRSAAARLLPLLALPLDTPVPPLHIGHETALLEIESPRTIPDDHPAIAALRAEVARLDQQVRIAELLAKPDVTIDASYGIRPDQTDMVTVVARMEFPFRRKATIDPKIREAVAARQAAEYRIEELKRSLLMDLGAAWEAHEDATRQIEFHSRVVLPQSRLAVESTRAAYEAGRATLDAVLGTVAAVVQLETDYADFLSQHVKSITDFHAIRAGARSGAIGGSMSRSGGVSLPAAGAGASASGSSMGMR